MRKGNKVRTIFISAIVCVLLLCFLLWLYETLQRNNYDKKREEQVPKVIVKSEKKLTAWTVYWDTNPIMQYLEGAENKLSRLIYFAAYFDKEGRLFIPERLVNRKKEISTFVKEYGIKEYLSIVNDKINADGTSNLKDTDILRSLFSSDASMGQHIDEIISLALDGGYDGIEIDYEAIRNDHELWKKYSDFIAHLQEEVEKNHLMLRVALEPSAPVEDICILDSVEYVMMCYNLYGYGTKPGPKVNKDFLLNLVKQMKKGKGQHSFALATGGFDFALKGKTSALTLPQAQQLEMEKGKNIHRNRKTKYKVFSYTEQGVSHKVWYADSVTLNHYITLLERKNEKNISLWRLDFPYFRGYTH